MAHSVGSTITSQVHGPATTGHNPVIKFKFTVSKIERVDANVKVTLSGMRFWIPSSGSAYYGYQIKLYVKVTNGSNKKLYTKPAADKIWDVNLGSVTLTSTNNLTNQVTIYVGAYAVDKKKCYSKDPTWVHSYIFTAPEYDTKYLVTYDSAGGIDGPTSQEFSVHSGMTVTEDKPTYPITITYHGRNTTTDNLYREFDMTRSWDTNGSPTATVAALTPGEYYSGDTLTSSITVFARWLSAPFIAPAGNEVVLVTFNPGTGGSVIPPVIALMRPILGYSRSSGGNIDYLPGSSYTTDADLDLYPVCDPAILQYSQLPIPTLPGYTFEGWYKDPTFTDKVTGDLSLTQDIILYARYYISSLWIKDNDGTWHRLYDDLDWERAPKVYKCVEENGVKSWQKVAQIYRCVRDEGTGQLYWEAF